MNETDGGPVFPRFIVSSEPGQPSTILAQTEGMTLRDWFAAMAVQGIYAAGSWDTRQKIAEMAYKAADAMLEARTKPL
jgi:hypothetical protein